MSRNPARNSAREHIAYLAARLMAEDGIEVSRIPWVPRADG